MKEANIHSLKILGIFGYLSLTLALLSVALGPLATGYEFSIYTALPITFWTGLTTSFLLGVILNILSSNENRSYGGLGILLCSMSTLVLIIAPFLRGYVYMGQGDVLTHVGYVRDLLSLSYTTYNVYPLEHIFTAATIMASGTGVSTAFTLIPIVFYFTGMSSVYALVKVLNIGSIEKSLLPLLVLPIFGSYCYTFAPWLQSMFFMPVVFLTYLKYISDGKPIMYLPMLIIIVVALVLYHPLAAVMAALFFVLMEVAIRVEHYYSRKSGETEGVMRGHPIFVTALIGLIMIGWHPYYQAIIQIMNKTTEILKIGTSASQSVNYATSLDPGTRIIEVIAYAGVRYFHIFLLLILILLGALILRRAGDLCALSSKGFPTIIFLLLCTCSLVPFSLLFVFGFDLFNVERIANTSLLLAITFLLLVPWFRESRRKWRKVLTKSCCFCLFALILSFSVINLYPSPMTLQANPQVTEQNMEGMDFIFQNRDKNIQIMEIGISQYRYYDAILGVAAINNNIRFYSAVPNHFGYYKAEGDYNLHDSYIIITSQGRYLHEVVYPDFYEEWSFYPSDYSMFENDLNNIKIYDNRELLCYMYL
jgi:hypothetical protein